MSSSLEVGSDEVDAKLATFREDAMNTAEADARAKAFEDDAQAVKENGLIGQEDPYAGCSTAPPTNPFSQQKKHVQVPEPLPHAVRGVPAAHVPEAPR